MKINIPCYWLLLLVMLLLAHYIIYCSSRASTNEQTNKQTNKLGFHNIQPCGNNVCGSVCLYVYTAGPNLCGIQFGFPSLLDGDPLSNPVDLASLSCLQKIKHRRGNQIGFHSLVLHSACPFFFSRSGPPTRSLEGPSGQMEC